jgi:hypothetical protein
MEYLAALGPIGIVLTGVAGAIAFILGTRHFK